MAPLYTARHISSNDKTVPLFTVKGLTNLAPSTLTNLNIVGVPLEKQVAFTQYADNISSFIWANVTRKTVTVTGLPLGLVNSKSKLPMATPPVSFILQKELDFEKAEKFVNNLGPGASKTKSGKTMIYTAPALDSEMYHRILSVSASHYSCGRESVTPAGIVAHRLISSCIAEFLKIHTYAAFSTPPEEAITEIRLAIGNEVTGLVEDCSKKKDKATLMQSYSAELARMGEVERDEDAMVELSAYQEEFSKLRHGVSSTGVDTVFRAKPSPVRESNMGPATAVPNMPGVIFPYFQGLIQPDSVIMSQFVIRRLYSLLGSTNQECQELYAKIRRGINSLSTTNEGMVLSHVILGVELALQTQGRCFLIIESKKYLGFALLGSKFAIFDSSHWIAPVDAAALRADLHELDPHLQAVHKLVGSFVTMTESSQYTGPAVSEETFNSPSSLIPVLKGIALDKIEDQLERELNQCFRSLNYMGSGYLQQNPQIVAEMLETFFSDAVVELDRPTYIPSIRTAVDTREFVLLSRFGPDAPSLWNERGTLFKCEARETAETSEKGKRKMGALDTYANMPDKILVTPKPLEISVRDFGKMVAEGGVKMDLKERAGKYRNMSIEAEVMRKRIWKALVDGMQEANKKRKTESKSKVVASEDFDDVIGSLLQ